MNQTLQPERPRSLAALIRGARTTYVLAIRAPLAEAGFEDIPRDGVFAIAAIGRSEISAGDLGRLMGASKQSVSQLLDTLVLRGYVERSVDPSDRRRMRLTLTGRGAMAADICRNAVDRIEHRVVETVGVSYVEHARATLMALIELAADLQPAVQPAGGQA